MRWRAALQGIRISIAWPGTILHAFRCRPRRARSGAVARACRLQHRVYRSARAAAVALSWCGNGDIVGAARTFGVGWLYVAKLWIASELRGKGHVVAVEAADARPARMRGYPSRHIRDQRGILREERLAHVRYSRVICGLTPYYIAALRPHRTMIDALSTNVACFLVAASECERGDQPLGNKAAKRRPQSQVTAQLRRGAHDYRVRWTVRPDVCTAQRYGQNPP